MKVAFISRWLWEEHRRAPERKGYFLELAEAVQNQGVEVRALSQSRDVASSHARATLGTLPVRLVSRDQRSVTGAIADKIIKCWGGYRKAWTDAMHIRKFLDNEGPFDILWAQCEEPDGLACALARQMGALPSGKKFPNLITQVHDLRYRFLEKEVRFASRSSLSWVFAKSDVVVANSPLTASWLHQHYAVPQNKTGVCRIHLQESFFKEAAALRAKQITPIQQVLYLGALNEKKAPTLFLEAAWELREKMPGFEFVLIGGETEHAPAYRKRFDSLLQRPGWSGSVKWLGKVGFGRLLEEIMRSRAVVCPSRIETFSRVTIEALALGRPVVVTSTTGAAHLIQETDAGQIVSPDNPQELAQAIEIVAQNQIFLENASCAVSLMEKERTVEKAASDLTALFRKTLN